jgi:hypothetical protein
LRRIVSLLAAALLMTTMLLTLPAASASAQTCIGCGGNFGFVPQGQFRDFDADDFRDFDADDFGFVPVNQGFFIDEDDLDDCDFAPGFGLICD